MALCNPASKKRKIRVMTNSLLAIKQKIIHLTVLRIKITLLEDSCSKEIKVLTSYVADKALFMPLAIECRQVSSRDGLVTTGTLWSKGLQVALLTKWPTFPLHCKTYLRLLSLKSYLLWKKKMLRAWNTSWKLLSPKGALHRAQQKHSGCHVWSKAVKQVYKQQARVKKNAFRRRLW